MSRIGITNKNICGIRDSETARQDPVTYTPFPQKKIAPSFTSLSPIVSPDVCSIENRLTYLGLFWL